MEIIEAVHVLLSKIWILALFFFFFDSPMKFEKVFNVKFQSYIILASTHIWIFLNFGMLWENLIKGSHKVGQISQSHPFSYHKRSHHLQPLSQTHPHDMPLYWKTTLQLFFPSPTHAYKVPHHELQGSSRRPNSNFYLLNSAMLPCL